MTDRCGSRNAGEVLQEANAIPNFVDRALHDPTFGDWCLLRQLAIFLIDLDSNDLLAHLFLVRAERNLGNRADARQALEMCTVVLRDATTSEVQIEGLRALIEQEQWHLRE